jgi:hypothetical protein
MTQFIVEKAANEKFKVGLYYPLLDVNAENAIIAATAVSVPEGLTLDGDVVISGQQVMQMMHGGAVGEAYLIQFTITTTDGSIYCSPNHDAILVRVI